MSDKDWPFPPPAGYSPFGDISHLERKTTRLASNIQREIPIYTQSDLDRFITAEQMHFLEEIQKYDLLLIDCQSKIQYLTKRLQTKSS